MPIRHFLQVHLYMGPRKSISACWRLNTFADFQLIWCEQVDFTGKPVIG